jgi:hypothetical protein
MLVRRVGSRCCIRVRGSYSEIDGDSEVDNTYYGIYALHPMQLIMLLGLVK